MGKHAYAIEHFKDAIFFLALHLVSKANLSLSYTIGTSLPLTVFNICSFLHEINHFF